MKTLLQKLAVILTLIISYPSYQNVQAQSCGAGYTLAGINFDLQYFQTKPSGSTKFTFGKNEMRLSWSGSNTFRGSVADHTGEGTSYGKGNDLKFIVGNGADTLTFKKEVSNLRYSIYDLDLNQVVVITAKNAAGTAQNITIVKDSTASSSQTITGSGTTSAKDSASSTAINLSNRGGTANVFIAGPLY